MTMIRCTICNRLMPEGRAKALVIDEGEPRQSWEMHELSLAEQMARASIVELVCGECYDIAQGKHGDDA